MKEHEFLHDTTNHNAIVDERPAPMHRLLALPRILHGEGRQVM